MQGYRKSLDTHKKKHNCKSNGGYAIVFFEKYSALGDSPRVVKFSVPLYDSGNIRYSDCAYTSAIVQTRANLRHFLF